MSVSKNRVFYPQNGWFISWKNHTLPETNMALKMDGWNTSFLLGWPIFRGYVSFRECIKIHGFGVNIPLFLEGHPCRGRWVDGLVALHQHIQ